MPTIYGPVPSWRFGRSLGVDVIIPPKKCTFNCVYCQLGKTAVHVPRPETLGELVGADQVLDDLDEILKRIDLKSLDVVTFSGAGEPTLNPRLGEIASRVKERVMGLPMVILTNSSLFHRDEVRKSLSCFDMIVAKLDAGDDEAFRLINRPANEMISIDAIVDSIKRVKREVKGTLALEVMLLRSGDEFITNVKGKHLRNLLDAILDVDPDVVQLEVPYRPPSEAFVKTPTRETMKKIFDELSESLGEDRLWVYGVHDERGRDVTWLLHESLEREIVELLRRRPCRVVDVSASLGIDLSTARNLLGRLRQRRIIASETSKGEKYYLIRG